MHIKNIDGSFTIRGYFRNVNFDAFLPSVISRDKSYMRRRGM